jgi:hypothetical protein
MNPLFRSLPIESPVFSAFQNEIAFLEHVTDEKGRPFPWLAANLYGAYRADFLSSVVSEHVAIPLP